MQFLVFSLIALESLVSATTIHEFHNLYRQQKFDPPLNPLAFNQKLGNGALKFAKTYNCYKINLLYGHPTEAGKDSNLHDPKFTTGSENIGLQFKDDPSLVTWDWVKEVNTPSGEQGHYLNAMSSSASEMGCGTFKVANCKVKAIEATKEFTRFLRDLLQV